MVQLYIFSSQKDASGSLRLVHSKIQSEYVRQDVQI